MTMMPITNFLQLEVLQTNPNINKKINKSNIIKTKAIKLWSVARRESSKFKSFKD